MKNQITLELESVERGWVLKWTEPGFEDKRSAVYGKEEKDRLADDMKKILSRLVAFPCVPSEQPDMRKILDTPISR